MSPSLILIPQLAKGNAAYLSHELVHVEQQRDDGTLTFWFKYLTSKAYRQQVEVEAYKAQIAAGTSLDTCAGHLANLYYLGISFVEAQQLLKE